MLKVVTVSAMALVLLSACSEQGAESGAAEASPTTGGAARAFDASTVALGGRLYKQNCATCHGSEGEGAPNWRQRDAEGRFPPPPLNGTGHTWHHPMRVLREVITHGSPGGQGNMPAWGNRLSPVEIDAIIAWFQSKWPDQAYDAWARMEGYDREGG
ncbi:MAG: c-type cytochrome [Pseudomonadota bacterium]